MSLMLGMLLLRAAEGQRLLLLLQHGAGADLVAFEPYRRASNLADQFGCWQMLQCVRSCGPEAALVIQGLSAKCVGKRVTRHQAPCQYAQPYHSKLTSLSIIASHARYLLCLDRQGACTAACSRQEAT